MEITDKIKSLTFEEVSVVYWQLKGESDLKIGQRFFFGDEWTRSKRKDAYKKLGIEGHWTAKHQALKQADALKIIEDLIGNDPENLKKFPLITNTKEKQQVQQIPLAVSHKPRPNRLLGCGIALLIAIAFIGGGGVVYYFLRPAPQVIVVTATSGPTTPAETLLPTSMSEPAPTLPIVAVTEATPTTAPTVFRPTMTPFLTYTTTPSKTPKPYFETEEWVEIKDNVFITLDNDINLSSSCFADSIVLRLELDNNGSSQFIVQFDSSAFRAVDDLGNTYSLAGPAGFNNCRNDPGNIDKVLYMGSSTYINIPLAGKMPLGITYLLVTADWISGVGPLTFRKDI